ncbi:MAG TPA: tetratricopeptide repeat protein [Sedimentisphaerales bacterium]|nr:tetratricopeptide repeat protein [Sedimentisphaerales bacterium]
MNKFRFSMELCLVGLLVAGCAPRASVPVQRDARQTVQLPPVDDESSLLGAIQRDFSNPDLHFRLGRVYHQQGKLASAEFEYERALIFDPLHFDSQAALVKLWLDAGNNMQAEREIDKYINRAGTAQNLVDLGMAFHRQGMLDAAKRCYDLAIRRDPQSAAAHKQLGLYYLSRNDRTSAGQMFTRSFELDPYQADVAMELGRLGITVRSRVAPLPTPAQPAPDQPAPAQPAPGQQ